MAAGVELQEHPLTGVAVAALPVLGRTPLPGNGHASPGKDAMHRGPREVQSLVLAQHLGQVLLVEPGVLVGGQFDHAPRLRG
ncbi:MAG: hypothetical protein ACR2MY_06460 [Candidatus Dormibacteria bacterium]